MRKTNSKRVLSITGLLCLLFIFLLSLPGIAQQAPLKFSHLTVDNGLSHTDAKAIKQDHLGFIWIATLFGLDRFDGYSIKSYYNSLDPSHNAFRNRIRDIYPDAGGMIWLVTDGGIQCFDSVHKRYLKIKSNDPGNESLGYSKVLKRSDGMLLTIKSNRLQLLHIDQGRVIPVKLNEQENFYDAVYGPDGAIWLCSQNGVWRLTEENKLHLIFKLSEVKDTGHLSKLFFNKLGTLSLVYGQHFVITDFRAVQGDANASKSGIKLTKTFVLTEQASINDVIDDPHHRYWISTDRGLYLLDPSLKILQDIHSSSTPDGLNANHLGNLMIDRSQCLWVCSYGGGVNYLDLNAKLFYTIEHNPDLSNTLSGNHIRSVLEEDPNTLWIGTNDRGVNLYHFDTKKFMLFDTRSKPVAIHSNVINALTLDKTGNLWIGTDQGIEILNKKRNSLIIPKNYRLFPHYNIEGLATDMFGNIWFGGLDNKMGRIIPQSAGGYRVEYFEPAHFIYADPDRPQIFAASLHGIIHFLLNANGDISRVFKYQANAQPTSLSSNYVYPIRKAPGNSIWVGTLGSGLNRLYPDGKGSYRAVAYTTGVGIFNDVECMETDDSGKVWMGGKGLEKFDPATREVIAYDRNDGLQGNSFKVGASFKGKNGRLYFGGVNGLNYFCPDSIFSNKLPAHPVFTGFEVNNKPVDPGSSRDSAADLPSSVSFVKHLTLNYLQNNFIIRFSGMHYANALKCKYRYKLDGFDKEWRRTDGASPYAAYSNLNYDDYTLLVQAANNDGIWGADIASLTLTVSPPWWRSTAAKAFYLLVFFSGLAGIYIYQGRWYRLKREFAVHEIEERKREEMHLHQEEMYREQLEFFTNISHEFRTPLSLILGPLEKLDREGKTSGWAGSYAIIHKNALRLVGMISELMNLRKVADGAVKLKVEPVIPNLFIAELAEEFNNLAETKKISFVFNHPDQDTQVWIDKQIVEKILFNLLNNAFKYTSEGGQVTLTLYPDILTCQPSYANEYILKSPFESERHFFLGVKDNGIGISKESISSIFDRYYRVSKEHLGSGVGLALVKSLNLIHKGDIYVFSEYGTGTEIIIALPGRMEDYAVTEQAETNDRSPSHLEKSDDPLIFENSSTQQEKNGGALTPKHQEHILIVEDNEELRSFLVSSLQEHYVIYEAANGSQGLELAKEKIPDLIISDVMMPIMDGVLFCKLIKDTFETSHIPFIILSARDTLESKLSGLGAGADYYFGKPLNIDLLIMTIHNVFEQKRKVKSNYMQNYYAEASELVHSIKDKEFLDKLRDLVETNIRTEELDVDYLCQQLGTSRTKLYQKIKSISGQSVGEFVRTIRLKKAAHIMTHEDVTIYEVVDRIGLQSASYFSRAFKKEFGKSPSTFLQELKNKSDPID